jgi:hypothetical protein
VTESVVASAEGGISTAFADVERVWRENRCLTEGTIWLYGIWAQRFTEHCRKRYLARTLPDVQIVSALLRQLPWTHPDSKDTAASLQCTDQFR